MILQDEFDCVNKFERYSVSKLRLFLSRLNEIRDFTIRDLDKTYIPLKYEEKKEVILEGFDLRSMELKEKAKPNNHSRQRKSQDFFPTQIKHENKENKEDVEIILNDLEKDKELFNENTVNNDLENLNKEKGTNTPKMQMHIDIYKTDKSLINLKPQLYDSRRLREETYLQRQKKMFEKSAWFTNQNKRLENLKDQINEIYSKSPVNIHDVLLVKSSTDKAIIPKIKEQCRSKSTTNLDLLLNKSRERFNDILLLNNDQEKLNSIQIGYQPMKPGKVFEINKKSKLKKLPTIKNNKLNQGIGKEDGTFYFDYSSSVTSKSTSIEDLLEELGKSMLKFKHTPGKLEMKNIIKRKRSSENRQRKNKV